MPITPNSDYRLNKPFSTPIIKIIEESPTVKSFIVKYNPIETKVVIQPGQFVMVWLPGNDEIPMSVAKFDANSQLTISVAAIGKTTEALHQLKEGDLIGIRGPYGNNYDPKPGTAIIVGGGIGMASILPIIYQLQMYQSDPTNSPVKIDKIICIEGVKTESELLYREELETFLASGNNLEICTDDGSCGFKGFTTERLDLLLKEELESQKQSNTNSPITVYTCGPEVMLKKVMDICLDQKIPIQLSLERMMRCGFGLCGLCSLEPTGLLVCRDGPIFTGKILQKVTDFGKYHRDFAGRPYPI